MRRDIFAKVNKNLLIDDDKTSNESENIVYPTE